MKIEITKEINIESLPLEKDLLVEKIKSAVEDPELELDSELVKKVISDILGELISKSSLHKFFVNVVRIQGVEGQNLNICSTSGGHWDQHKDGLLNFKVEVEGGILMVSVVWLKS
ncbi:hypothetical protein PP7435_CHR4-1708 [Komagataella phaffii CBS 7435]|uniref:Topoisomerase I damage affected protein 2 n=2 Tax=Komagataella phaffii TaxID=460519 RepID=C4R7F1_KOMPG|nr:Hypothetical protein PAS_chr4_0289 [Komagataella phaffii GS115]AOA64430.1 GQ67_04623T0 [Komagataella phaffii]KAI0461331.1 hypothetical protein LJB42_000998 [Komagataella kurtzmanii]CAH2451100.1 hypothetical protein BQ9382_C4-3740 [Komagataella phaffii CBS 7435]AOA70424.1 GQ68_04595T0 [Komagataella phaffii GS115]CAY71526.1 Hypothetical protein PAS_chr4_0289 [Komagataella phaffii GS115]